MKFRFIGDPAHNFDGPDAFEKFGLNFSRSEWTEVDDKWVISKLLGNAHFEVMSASMSGLVAPAPVDAGREALIAQAEALGVSVDRRWSNATLMLKISEAKAARA